MLIGIDVNETVDYVSKLEQGAESPTVFVIGNIPNTRKEFLKNATDIIKAGLREIRNFSINGQAHDVVLVDEKVINMIPFKVLVELAEKISEFNGLSVEEEKN